VQPVVHGKALTEVQEDLRLVCNGHFTQTCLLQNISHGSSGGGDGSDDGSDSGDDESDDDKYDDIDDGGGDDDNDDADNFYNENYG